jgi:hypothetical protein
MPHWENNNDWIRGDYLKLDENEYLGGRYTRPSAVLGKDYVPTLVQHPLSGKMIAVAPRSTVVNAAGKQERSAKRDGGGENSYAKAQKTRMENQNREQRIKNEIRARVYTLVHAKVAKVEQKQLAAVTAQLVSHLDAEVGEIAPLFGIKGSYNALPKKAASLKSDVLLRVIYMLVISNRVERDYNSDDELKAVAKEHGVDLEAIAKAAEEKHTPKKPVDQVNAEIDKRAAKGKKKVKATASAKKKSKKK